MKTTGFKYLAIVSAGILIILASLSCNSPITPTPASNNDVLNYEEFSLSADSVSLETNVSGTIYIKGDIEKPEDRRVQIAARMEIDNNDWGGIGFGFPPGWEITGITSDYPQDNPKPESYVTTMSTASDEEIVTFVYVGATNFGAPEVQGGQGSIIIELAWENEKQELPENFRTIIGIGSKYDYIVHPVHETYEVPLNTDYHDVSPYYLLPSPGTYLYDEQFEKSGVALKDVRTEIVTANADYFNPSHLDATVKKGETCLIVTGHVQNMDKENTEIVLWAKGNDTYGNTVAWTLEWLPPPGRIWLHLEYMEVGEFTLHLNLPEDMITVRMYAAGYPVASPVAAQPENALDGSRWKLLTIKGKSLVPGSYISLNFLDGKLWGSAGLNTYGAYYTMDEPGTLVFSAASMTQLGGTESIVAQEKEYMEFFWGSEISYSITDNRLEIFDAAAPQDSLVFERLPHNPFTLYSLFDTSWQLVYMNSEPVPKELSITINFDQSEASGTAGCFAYQLPYDTSLDLHGSGIIRWGIINRRTGELAPELEIIASRYTGKIALADSFRLTDDKLEIFTAGGDTLEYTLVSHL